MKVKEKLWSIERFPESKSPPSAVTVWVLASLFVKVTRAPLRTVRLDGVKAKFMILTDDAIIGGTVGRGVGAGVGRGVATTGCGAGAAVSTGAGEAVGEGVELAAAGDGDGGGDDCRVACAPQAVSKQATRIASSCRIMCSSVEKCLLS
jgi:hypothetical protein